MTFQADLATWRSALQCGAEEEVRRIAIQETDLLLECRDGTVGSWQSLLQLHSRVVRAALPPVKQDLVHLLLPEWGIDTVRQALKLLQLDWTEDTVWGGEVVQLLTVLGIQLGDFQPLARPRLSKGPASKKRPSQAASARVVAGPASKRVRHDSGASTRSIGSSFSGSSAFSNATTSSKASDKSIYKVKCSYAGCSYQKSGVVGRIKDGLRNHIGNRHYGKELAEEARRYFIGNSNKCTECGKTATQPKKHILFNHTKYVDEVLMIVNEIVEKVRNPMEAEVEAAEEDSTSSAPDIRCSFFLECGQAWEDIMALPDLQETVSKHLLAKHKAKLPSAEERRKCVENIIRDFESSEEEPEQSERRGEAVGKHPDIAKHEEYDENPVEAEELLESEPEDESPALDESDVVNEEERKKIQNMLDGMVDSDDDTSDTSDDDNEDIQKQLMLEQGISDDEEDSDRDEGENKQSDSIKDDGDVIQQQLLAEQEFSSDEDED